MNAKIKVALVDDDSSLCRALSRLLATAGIESTAFPSAEAYLEALPTASSDCVLLDLQLPGLSGIDLRRHLSTDGHTTPVIFITADDSTESREQALRLGCDGYFLKTDPGRLIIDAIHRALTARQPVMKKETLPRSARLN